MTDKPRRNPFVTIKSKVSITGIKSIVGSIVKIGSINIGRAILPAIVASAAVVGTGEVVGAWDVLDSERPAVEVIAIIPTGEPGNIILVPAQTAPTILEEILAAALDDPTFPAHDGVSRAEVEAIVDAAIAEIIGAYVPPGPPLKIDGLIDTVEDTNCVVRRGTACPVLPDRVTE